MTEPLSGAERARRRRLATLAASVGIPIVVVLLLALVLASVFFGVGPFTRDVVMDGAPPREVPTSKPEGKADR